MFGRVLVPETETGAEDVIVSSLCCSCARAVVSAASWVFRFAICEVSKEREKGIEKGEKHGGEKGSEKGREKGETAREAHKRGVSHC